MPDNNENIEWNDIHQGKRVPINDTGLEGAPAALSSQDPNWADGSLNKAVYNTHILTDTFPIDIAPDAIAGLIDLRTLGNFITKDMLYGYIGDARNKVPGDMMSYRGYPTPVISNNLFALVTPTTQYNLTLAGTLSTTLGNWLILSHKLSITYKLPYDFIYTITFKREATILHTLQVKIPSGMTVPSVYRVGVYESITEGWISLPQNKVFFSVETTALTGDITTSVVVDEVLQAPYHGTLQTETLVTPQSVYKPVTPPITYNAGQAYKNPFIIDMWHYLNVCNEIPSSPLFFGSNGVLTQMYLKNEDSYIIGKVVYSNVAGTTPIEPGTYAFAQWVYEATSSGSTFQIYSMTRIIAVNATGVITTVYNLTPTLGCW